jgi:hypothetical protein
MVISLVVLRDAAPGRSVGFVHPAGHAVVAASGERPISLLRNPTIQIEHERFAPGAHE